MEIHSDESVIKQEIKEEDEVRFELVEVQSCVKKEVVSNEVEKIESCLDVIDSQSGFVTDGVKEENKMKQEMEEIEFKEEEINCEWTDHTEVKTDLLALYPTVEIKVKPKFTEDENTIPTTDALPSTSRGDGSESSNDVEKDSENDFSCPQFDSFQLEPPTNEVLNKELIGNKSFYKCKECDYICDSASHYKVHRMRHTGERPFKCNVCEYSSVTSSDIKRHSKVHMTLCSEKTYSCKQCELCFTNPTSLKIHSRSHDGKDDSCKPYDYSSTKVYTGTKIEIKLYKCNECDYSCAQPGYLKRHMQKHTGYKPFKCKECNYACTTASRLNVHMKRHIGDKPYKCSLCEYSCVTSSDIKRHTLRHSGIKPYKCNECYFSCSKKSTLKVHMESHTVDTA